MSVRCSFQPGEPAIIRTQLDEAKEYDKRGLAISFENALLMDNAEVVETLIQYNAQVSSFWLGRVSSPVSPFGIPLRYSPPVSPFGIRHSPCLSRAMGWVGSGYVALEPVGGYGRGVHLPLSRLR